jgi:hypothetical protein
MSSNGTIFVGCKNCYDDENIEYGNNDGRRFERRVSETGYRNGSQTIEFDSDGDIEQEGDPEFYDGFEPDDNEYDYGDEITCTYCGYEVKSYGESGLVTLWEDDDEETITLYAEQDEDSEQDEEIVTPIVIAIDTGRLAVSREAADLAVAFGSATQDVSPDTTEITLNFVP